MKEILNKFYDLNSKLQDRMYELKANDIFKNIPMKMEVFYERFDKECMDIPIFKYSEPEIMFQRISNASNEDIVIIKDKLLTRAIKNEQLVFDEFDNLYKLKNIITSYLENKDTSIKTVVLNDFAKGLERIMSEKMEEKDVKKTKDL